MRSIKLFVAVLLLSSLCHAQDRKFFAPAGVKVDSVESLLSQKAELSRRVDDLLNETAAAAQAKYFTSDVERERDQLRVRVRELEQHLEDLKPFSISGLEKLKATPRPVQWVITTSPGCGYCPGFKRNIVAKLRHLGWEIGDSPDDQFRFVEITDEEWRAKGLALPESRLIVNGETVERLIGVKVDPAEMSRLYNRQSSDVPAGDSAYGIGVGSIPAKPQVEAILNALKPFLDGGTLRVEYTPKAGVVREWLTIKQGAAGVKIPAKTAIMFSFEGDQFVGRFDGQSPRVIVGPFERSPSQIEVSPSRIAIRLPWCPDPEISLTK